MDSSFWFYTITLVGSIYIYILRDHRLKFRNEIVVLSLKIVFFLANSVDWYFMLHYVTFHSDLQGLSQCTFRSH